MIMQQGEHGFHTAHCQVALWDTTLYVPLVMRLPGVFDGGRRVEHDQVDLRRSVSADVEDRTLLSQFLRENLNLTGTHVGCDTSQCGACVVHVDGKAVKSCTMLAAQASGSDVTTIERVREDLRGWKLGRALFVADSGMNSEDNRAELARAVVEQGWDLLELSAMGMSLEEIFLKVTEGVSIEELAKESAVDESEEEEWEWEEENEEWEWEEEDNA